MTEIDGFELIAPQAYGERGVPHDQWRELRKLDRLHHCAPEGFDAAVGGRRSRQGIDHPAFRIEPGDLRDIGIVLHHVAGADAEEPLPVGLAAEVGGIPKGAVAWTASMARPRPRWGSNGAV